MDELAFYMLKSEKDFQTEFKRNKPSKDDPIVMHCKLGFRSHTAQLALLGAGYTNVRLVNLKCLSLYIPNKRLIL